MRLVRRFFSNRVAVNAFVVAVNLAVLWFAFSWFSENVRIDELLNRVSEIPVPVVLASVAINLAAMVLYGLRLGCILAEPAARATTIAVLGFGLNSVLPMRIGEVAKVYYARRLFAMPPGRMIMATGVEKAIDLSMIALLAALAVFLVDFHIVGDGFLPTFLGVLVAAAGAVLVWRRHGHVIARRLAASAVGQAVHGFLSDQVRPERLTRILALTAVIWVLNVLSSYVAFLGLAPQSGFGLSDALAILLISVLAIAIPSAPAGLGVFEAGIVVYLTQKLDVPNEQAVMGAIVFHLIVSMPQVLLMGAILALKRPADGIPRGPAAPPP